MSKNVVSGFCFRFTYVDGVRLDFLLFSPFSLSLSPTSHDISPKRQLPTAISFSGVDALRHPTDIHSPFGANGAQMGKETRTITEIDITASYEATSGASC
jgi:hypothetical protein